MRFKRKVVGLTLSLAVASGFAVAHAGPANAQGYPAGTGEFSYGAPWFNSVVQSFGGSLDLCGNSIRAYFQRAYIDEQAYIRQAFTPGYMLGRPARHVTAVNAGQFGRSKRLYQVFSGGSWGESELMQSQQSIPGSVAFCWRKPVLITGAIFNKFRQLGYQNTLGGPISRQYHYYTSVRQNFERGQIGFEKTNPSRVVWRYWHERNWHP